MAFKNLVAFGAGEITPELSERGTLEKYRTGLRKLRNAIVSKMGGLRDRAGTIYVGNEVEDSKIYAIKNKGILVSFRRKEFIASWNFDEYNKVFTSTTTKLYIPALPDDDYFTAQDIKDFVISHSDEYIYVTCEKGMMRISLSDWSITFLSDFMFEGLSLNTSSGSINSTGFTAPTGYLVDYIITGVINGVENPAPIYSSSIGVLKIPAAAGQGQNIEFQSNYKQISPVAFYPIYDSINVYRRPSGSGNFGYVGSSEYSIVTVGGFEVAKYKVVDFGGAADFSIQKSDYLQLFRDDNLKTIAGPFTFFSAIPTVNTVYQDRIIMNGTKKASRVFGTKTGTATMIVDTPLNDSSAVGFAVTSDGGGKIHRFFDNRGLVIATNVGIYETPSDILKYSTAYALRKSSIVHSKYIPIMGIPNGMLTYDERLKAVYRLIPSGTNFDYTSDEISIYSAHLFKGKDVVAWDILNDFTQSIFMVMSDGTANILTYQDEQQLRSFSWFDTKGKFKDIAIITVPNKKDAVFVKTFRNNSYFLEYIEDRDNTDYGLTCFTDCSKVQFKQAESNPVLMIPATESLDGGEMYLSTGDLYSNTPFNGQEGTIFRLFNKLKTDYIDIEVIQYINTGLLKVKFITSKPFNTWVDYGYEVTVTSITPVTVNGESCNRRIDLSMFDVMHTTNVITGLAHLEGQQVSIRKDGLTHASPLNTENEYNVYTVTGGQVVLDPSDYGSIFATGLPYVVDIRTLQVDTIEQSPVKLESQITNKLWLSFNESRGCFLGSEFPKDDTITGMNNAEDLKVNPETEDIDVNHPIQPYSTREEFTMVGDWTTQSSVCIRKVDPQPLGLKAIILDSEILRR